MIAQPSQKPGIDAHCFGDCGKVSMAGGIDDDLVGPLFVCCEHECPYLDKQMDEPFGTTNSFGRPHEVYLRTIKQPATTSKSPPRAGTEGER
jgi:hypothetical protein